MCALSAKEIGYLKDHFIESVTENWRYFRFQLVLSRFKGGGMFICSKLRQNLSEMEVSTFERIQRVIWGHFQKQASFSFL